MTIIVIFIWHVNLFELKQIDLILDRYEFWGHNTNIPMPCLAGAEEIDGLIQKKPMLATRRWQIPPLRLFQRRGKRAGRRS